MISIALDLQPGETAFFRVGNRDYAIACAGQGEESLGARNAEVAGFCAICGASSQRARELQTRQLALSASGREQGPPLPDGISLRHEDELWIARDRYADDKVIAWAADREIVAEVPSVWLFISDEHTFGPVNGRASLPASRLSPNKSQNLCITYK